MHNSCPQCHSKSFKRNGYTRHGKQNHRCLDCGRQFSLEPYAFDLPLHDSGSIQSFLTEKLSLLKDIPPQSV